MEASRTLEIQKLLVIWEAHSRLWKILVPENGRSDRSVQDHALLAATGCIWGQLWPDGGGCSDLADWGDHSDHIDPDASSGAKSTRFLGK